MYVCMYVCVSLSLSLSIYIYIYIHIHIYIYIYINMFPWDACFRRTRAPHVRRAIERRAIERGTAWLHPSGSAARQARGQNGMIILIILSMIMIINSSSISIMNCLLLILSLLSLVVVVVVVVVVVIVVVVVVVLLLGPFAAPMLWHVDAMSGLYRHAHESAVNAHARIHWHVRESVVLPCASNVTS